MRKILTTLLTLTLVLSLTACGESGTNSELKDTLSSPESEEMTNETDDESASDSIQEELPVEEDSAANTTAPITFEEISVVDNEECTIAITGIDEDNLWGYTLNAFLENKSSDKTYMFSVTTASINGVKIDPLFANEVAAGKKQMKKLLLPPTPLKKMELHSLRILHCHLESMTVMTGWQTLFIKIPFMYTLTVKTKPNSL